jgi:hypothetical protein
MDDSRNRKAAGHAAATAFVDSMVASAGEADRHNIGIRRTWRKRGITGA